MSHRFAMERSLLRDSPACGTLTAVLVTALLAVSCSSPPAGERAADMISLHPSNRDPSVSPATDFYRFANGGWIDRNPVPDEESSWGTFQEVRRRNESVLREILEADPAANASADERKLIDFYCSCMDVEQIERAGLTPIRNELELIDGITDREGVQDVLTHLHSLGVFAVFSLGSEPDYGDATRVIGRVRQGGLGLPDREDYLRDDERSAALRASYVAHVARALELVGASPALAGAGADVVLGIETRLAEASMTRVQSRDADLVYNPRTMDAAAALMPNFSWNGYFHLLGLNDVDRFNVSQPEFFRAFDRLLDEVPVSEWRLYLRWQLLRHTAPTLPAAFADAHFAFFSGVLRGVEQERPRWKRCVDATSRAMGHALGRAFVERTFSPEAKRKAQAMVSDLRATFAERLQTREWMSEVTRARALGKLQHVGEKIGYPERWRDYSGLRIDRGPYAANALRGRAFGVAYQLDKIGQPVDPDEWGMPPHTVNAYYSATRNEIVFPAGILQPPFFGVDQDAAANYGAMGAVIGHELSHGFDDQGAKFDAAGNKRNWWSDDDLAEFQRRGDELVAQFDAYEALPSEHVNGRLTLGENIGDLGGLTIALQALRRAQADQPAEPVDGFTSEQRFFLAWAQTWRSTMREETVRVRLATDSHAPPRFRVLGPLSNMAEFHAAFGVTPSDPMWRAADVRVEIW